MSGKTFFVFLAVIILLELILVGCPIFEPVRPPSLHKVVSTSALVASPSCAVQIEEKTVEGTSMSPLVKPGEVITALYGYYACHPIERGDIVLYHYAGDKNPLIKIVKAVPGDRWSLGDKNGDFLILVNGKVLKNSEGNEYQIPDTNKILPLYAEDYPVIPQNAYLILGDDPTGSLDSSRFGLISGEALLGKVVLK